MNKTGTPPLAAHVQQAIQLKAAAPAQRTVAPHVQQAMQRKVAVPAPRANTPAAPQPAQAKAPVAPQRVLAPHVQQAIQPKIAAPAQRANAPVAQAAQRVLAPHVQNAIQPKVTAPMHRPAAPHVQTPRGGAVAQALFWEYTRGEQYIWHYGPVSSWWWRKKESIDGTQVMKDGYGVWLRIKDWGSAPTSLLPISVSSTPRTDALRVGRRTAFFEHSQAEHAVFELNGVVWGLAGDFNGVGLAEDESKSSVFKWVGTTAKLSKSEAKLFQEVAELTANKLSYNLLWQNCYTPVSAGLTKLIDFTDDDKVRNDLQTMLGGLGQDNFGRGTVSSTQDEVYIKIVKKNE